MGVLSPPHPVFHMQAIPLGEDPRSQLIQAIIENSTSRVAEVLESKDVQIDDEHNRISLFGYAARFSSTPVMDLLLQKGADANGKSTLFELTPLHIAAAFAKTDVIQFLMENGADLNPVDLLGRTPLWMSLFFGDGYLVVVEALAERADVNFIYSKNTPLTYALRTDRLKLAEILVRANAKIGEVEGAEGILENIAEHDRPQQLRIACDAGAYDTGGLALLKAIHYCNRESVKVLLECSDTGNKYVNEALTPVGANWLIHSILGQKLSVKIMRLLVDAGTDTISKQTVEIKGEIWIDETPREYVLRMIDYYRYSSCGKKENLHDITPLLEEILRLWKREAAVHATSWLWTTPAVNIGKGGKANVAATLPTFRLRAKHPRVVQAALYR